MAIGAPQGSANAQTQPETGLTQNQTMREFLDGIEDTPFGIQFRRYLLDWILVNCNGRTDGPAIIKDVFTNNYDIYTLLCKAASIRIKSDWQIDSEIRKQEITLEEAIGVVYEEVKQFAIDSGAETIENENTVREINCETCKKAGQVLEKRATRHITKTVIAIKIKEKEEAIRREQIASENLLSSLNRDLAPIEKAKILAFRKAMALYETYSVNKEKLQFHIKLMGYNDFGFTEEGSAEINQEDPRYLRYIQSETRDSLYTTLDSLSLAYTNSHKEFKQAAELLFQKLEEEGKINSLIDLIIQKRDKQIAKQQSEIAKLDAYKVY